MRFVLEIRCDTKPFSGEPPTDLLTETARILTETAQRIRKGEFSIPLNSIEFSPREIDDLFGHVIGEAYFTLSD